MILIARSIFLFILALVWAWLEIEIEGKYGWSEKTQTWYRYNPKSLVNKFLGGKPLTGYHIMVFGTALLVSHLPFVFGLQWTLTNELWILSIHLTWTPLWDYLWFLCNPNYQMIAFKKNKVWWYNNSVWIAKFIPFEQLLQWIIALILALIAGKFFDIGGMMLIMILLTIISSFTLVPVYKKWYLTMRLTDDRNKTNIFHNT